MKMFHIDDFKCTLCANWFCPPFNLPYLLPCTHSICTHCLQKAAPSDQIICPEDLEACPLKAIYLNQTTKRALERLMKEHKNYNQNTQLECIKNLSVSFDEVISTKQKQLQNIEALFDQIYQAEIERIRQIHEKVRLEINRPIRIIQDWKEIVTIFLTNLKNSHRNSDMGHDIRSQSMAQMNHYIQQGRKIKLQLNQFFTTNFQSLADRVIKNPAMCLDKNFTINIQEVKAMPKNQNKKENNKSQISIEDSQENMLWSEPNSSRDENESIYRKGFQQRQYGAIVTQQSRVQPVSIDQSSIGLAELSNNKIGRILQTNQPMQNLASFLNSQNEELEEKQKYMKNVKNQTKQQDNLNQYLDAGEKKNPFLNEKSQFYSKPIQNKVQAEKVMKENVSGKTSKNSSLSNSRRNGHSPEFSLSHFQLESQNNGLESYFQDCAARDEESNDLRSEVNSFKMHHTESKPINQKMSRKDKKITKQVLEKEERKFVNNPFKKCDNNIQMLMHLDQEDDKRVGCTKSHTIHEDQGANEEMLLEGADLQSSWNLENINFMKKWQIEKGVPEDEQLEIRQKGYYNCQKQKTTYMRKMQMVRAQQAYKATIHTDNNIQLINESLQEVDMNLYLQQFDWQNPNNPIEIVKFVRTGLNDDQLNILLNYLVKSRVKALVLSANNLTDISLDAFLYFVEVNTRLKNVYLPKNFVNIMKSKAKINLLKEKGINIYI